MPSDAISKSAIVYSRLGSHDLMQLGLFFENMRKQPFMIWALGMALAIWFNRELSTIWLFVLGATWCFAMVYFVTVKHISRIPLHIGYAFLIGLLISSTAQNAVQKNNEELNSVCDHEVPFLLVNAE